MIISFHIFFLKINFAQLMHDYSNHTVPRVGSAINSPDYRIHVDSLREKYRVTGNSRFPTEKQFSA